MSRARSVLAGWHVEFSECWSDWMPWNIGRMNWRNFTVAHVDFEWTTSFPRSLEFTFIIAGVGVWATWYEREDVEVLEAMRDNAIAEIEASAMLAERAKESETP